MKRTPTVANGQGNGYPPECILPATPEEQAACDRLKARMNANGSKPLGAPNYHQRAGSDRLRIGGLTYEEAEEYCRTGVWP